MPDWQGDLATTVTPAAEHHAPAKHFESGILPIQVAGQVCPPTGPPLQSCPLSGDVSAARRTATRFALDACSPFRSPGRSSTPANLALILAGHRSPQPHRTARPRPGRLRPQTFPKLPVGVAIAAVPGPRQEMSRKTGLPGGQFTTPEAVFSITRRGWRCISLPAAACPTNGTSLSVEPPASLQQLVAGRQRRYDPLWSHSLS